MRTLITMTLMAMLATPLAAREELVTLPKRDGVKLTIYNSVDLTLVSETRTLAFKEGANKLSFSWANTLIDPTSVIFRAVEKPDELDVADTSFPRESNQMLVWTVNADKAGDYKVEISYFTSGISWSAEYIGVLNAEGSAMELTSNVTIFNNSGEEYENATVRMVLGTIHLVEDVSDLANGEKRKMALGRMRDGIAKSEAAAAEDRAEIIKEGLSEYYVYTVRTSEPEGRMTVPNGWAKSLQSFHVDNVPVEFVYTYNSRKYGTELRRVYSFVNDEAHSLGKEPLPGGVVRLYERKGNDGLGYVAALGTEYIPKGEEVKIVGDSDPNVTIEIKVMKYRRTNLNFRTKDEVKSLIGWDDVRDFVVVVKNFRGSAIKAEVTLNFSGDFEVAAADGTTLIHDSATTRMLKLNIPAGESSTSGFTLTVHNQENAKRGR